MNSCITSICILDDRGFSGRFGPNDPVPEYNITEQPWVLLRKFALHNNDYVRVNIDQLTEWNLIRTPQDDDVDKVRDSLKVPDLNAYVRCSCHHQCGINPHTFMIVLAEGNVHHPQCALIVDGNHRV